MTARRPSYGKGGKLGGRASENVSYPVRVGSATPAGLEENFPQPYSDLEQDVRTTGATLGAIADFRSKAASLESM
jgi:hypothetical protein